MNPRPDFNWTPEAVETLTKHWAAGLSCSAIAAEMGEGLTRNSIIGKVHRLKLPARSASAAISKEQRQRSFATWQGMVKNHGNKGQPKANAIVAKVAAKRSEPANPLGPQFGNRSKGVEPFDMEDGEGVDVGHLIGIMENKGCKFISGDPLAVHTYCNKPFKAGSKSWCETHHDRVFLRSTR